MDAPTLLSPTSWATRHRVDCCHTAHCDCRLLRCESTGVALPNVPGHAGQSILPPPAPKAPSILPSIRHLLCPPLTLTPQRHRRYLLQYLGPLCIMLNMMDRGLDSPSTTPSFLRSLGPSPHQRPAYVTMKSFLRSLRPRPRLPLTSTS